MDEAALLPKNVETPSPMPPNKRPLEPSNEPTTEDHPPKRPAVDLQIKPGGDTMNSHIDLTCLPKTESKASQSPSPKSTGKRESSDSIKSMTNEELEESIKARLPINSRMSAEMNSGSAAPAIGVPQRALSQDISSLLSLVHRIEGIAQNPCDGNTIGRELGEMAARLEVVSNVLTALIEDMNDLLDRYTLVPGDDFQQEEVEDTPGDPETGDLESFTEGGYNNPMRIEDDETHVIN